MTTLTGIRGKDFIVLGSDSQVTAGNLKIPFPYPKIQKISDNLIVSGAGSVGYLQRVLAIALRNIRINKISVDDLNLDPSLSDLSRNLSELNFSIPLEHKHFSPFSFILGGLNENGEPSLINVGDDGSIIDVPTFICEGSGSNFAYSIISQGYKDNLTLDEAINLTLSSLNESGKLDVYTNSKVSIVYLIFENDEWKIKSYLGKKEDTNLNNEKGGQNATDKS